MGKIIKLFQASDIHDNANFGKTKAIRDFVNKQGDIKATLLLGDFFNEERYSSVGAKGEKGAGRRAFESLSQEEKSALQLEGIAARIGGIDKIKSELEHAEDSEREQIAQFIERYESSRNEIELAKTKFKQIQQNVVQESKSIDEIIEEMSAMFSSDISVFDQILGGINTKVYGVRGNWDPDAVYGLKNMHFVEKEPIVIEGLSFAGVSGWYEKVILYPDQFYQDAEIEPTNKELEQLLAQENGEERARELLENNPVYQRLKDQDIDVLLTHKGAHGLAELHDGQNSGYGLGLGRIIEEKKPIVLGGHIHSGLYDGTTGYQGVRSGEKAYVLHVDVDEKKIVQIDKYRFKQKGLEQELAKAA